MDRIYGHFNDNASSKIQIEEHFVQFLDQIVSSGCFIPIKKHEQHIFDMMGVALGQDEMSMLKTYCSIDNLTVDGEMSRLNNARRLRRKDIFGPQEPADANLQTLHSLRRRKSLKTRKPICKYKSEIIINHKMLTSSGEFITPGEEILIFVRVYCPFKNSLKHECKSQMGSKLLLSSVIAVLGSQTLADLRDLISCTADYTISTDCSENPKNTDTRMAKDVYKSGFFFIEDTFYNDMRDPSNIDYSKIIMEWAQRRPEFGPFEVVAIDSCRLDSMRLRFGFPWVYRHQGGCEHLICFADARFVNNDDELLRSEYPRIVRVKPRYSKLCMICGLYCARWITMHHERIPHNPCFFCDLCFKSYNYVDGKKVGKFQAYPYPRNIERAKNVL